jgi:putative acetyltransferase
MRIRPAARSDASEIRRIHLLAFPTDAEADLVEELVRDGSSRISLVGVEGGRLVGHVLFSRMNVDVEGEQLSALGLAPIAVLPDQQNRGIASALIERGIAEARRLGTDVIFVLGEPRFYGRFGFDAKAAEPFACAYAGPHFAALILNRQLRTGGPASASYAPAFDAL